jgi:hypothetical protein
LLSEQNSTLAEAIKNRTAIAVSDGSFAEGYGSATWVLEGDNEVGRLSGEAIVPGLASDQSAPCSELTGLYSILLHASHKCDKHRIQEGSLEVACDGLSALQAAFADTHSFSTDKPNFDQLGAIYTIHRKLPITTLPRHVKGHQDQHKTTLDRWEALNVEMDAMAKDHIAIAKQQPRHHYIQHAPWSILIQGRKITCRLQKSLYEHIHGSIANLYWEKKEGLSTEQMESVHWEALSKARHQSSMSRNRFVTKHIVGMCKVGKFMVR